MVHCQDCIWKLPWPIDVNETPGVYSGNVEETQLVGFGALYLDLHFLSFIAQFQVADFQLLCKYFLIQEILPPVQKNFFFWASSLDKARKTNPSFCCTISRSKRISANVRRASCSFGNVTSSVWSILRMAASFPRHSSSTVLVLIPIVSRVSFTSAFVGTSCFFQLLSLGSSGTSWIHKL